MSPNRIFHIVVLGHGAVGHEFIRQVLCQSEQIVQRRHIELRIIAIANSRQLLIDPKGIGADWRERLSAQPTEDNIPQHIVGVVQSERLDRLILVDNTASDEVALQYPYYIAYGFDIVSSNKRANTLPWAKYQEIHAALSIHGRTYRYETNVGAGLPLIDNIKLLHLSGERILRIHGVFSGSLSYIFNNRNQGKSLSMLIDEAVSLGYAEPDPREDLSGLDVARKVLILARELDIELDLEDVELQSLVPEYLRALPYHEFRKHISELEAYINTQGALCADDEVLRYTGEVIWDEEIQTAKLRVGLSSVKQGSALGLIRDADNCFEIYTESYGALPIVIQGAGAGAKVTARGVFGDVLRLAERQRV